jgi:hypothetical protein
LELKTQILAALTQYDPDNPDHWTTDGMPKMWVMQEAVPALANVTRKMVTEAAPDFDREFAHAQRKPADPVPPQVVPQDPEASVEEAPVLAKDPGEPQAQEELSKDQVQRMAEEMEDLDVQMAAMDAEIEKAKVARRKIEIARDGIANQLDKQERIPFSDAVKRHQQSQQALRAERVEGAKRLRNLAKSVDAPMPAVAHGSKLDAAMARRTARGTARPQWPGREMPAYPKRG